MREAAAIAGVLVWLILLVTAAGVAVTAAGAYALRRFARRRRFPAGETPPVTILRPLFGDEPRLDEALASICNQSYPAFQIILGVQDPADPAIAAVRRAQARFPHRAITLVIDPASHGPNRKISNLINMLAAARHDWLVFSDSDMHVPPDYVRRLVDALAVPGTGLITTLSAGLPTAPGLGARLGAMHVTYSFLPAVLLARALGRQDCLGTTMALRRETLERIGGLEAVATYLAEDNVVGQKVRALGLGVGLADTIPATAVAERGLRPLWQRELRWARTIRSLEPCGFAASMLQFPLFWAVLLCLLTAGSALALAVLAVVWLSRAAMMVWIARMLRRRGPSLAEFLLSPLRDIMSVAQIVVSFAGSQVVWRGHVMRADRYRGPVLSNHGNEVH